MVDRWTTDLKAHVSLKKHLLNSQLNDVEIHVCSFPENDRSGLSNFKSF